MDWDKFIQDNAQSLFALGGVFLGSLITFLINYFNNRFQAKEREKDREEQRREAKIQAKEKRVEKDIEIIMETINDILEYLGLRIRIDKLYTDIKDKEMGGVLSPEESDNAIDNEYNYLNELTSTLRRKHTLAEGIVYSYRNIIGYWEAFDESMDELIEYIKENPHTSTDKSKAWKNFMVSTGNLQKVLRHEPISIRDEEI